MIQCGKWDHLYSKLKESSQTNQLNAIHNSQPNSSLNGPAVKGILGSVGEIQIMDQVIESIRQLLLILWNQYCSYTEICPCFLEMWAEVFRSECHDVYNSLLNTSGGKRWSKCSKMLRNLDRRLRKAGVTELSPHGTKSPSLSITRRQKDFCHVPPMRVLNFESWADKRQNESNSNRY